jgi:hypothetical protein
MSDLLQNLLTAIGANALLLLGFSYWIEKALKRHEKELEQANALALARFGKYHLTAVDSIAETYARLVDTHNAVFRFCFPDWDSDGMPSGDRQKAASDSMVNFYVYFRKNQIFMDRSTTELFERSFRFLQEVLSKKDERGISPDMQVRVGMTVLADLTKTFPGMLDALRAEIGRVIGPYDR